jgi:hypothetical protein
MAAAVAAWSPVIIFTAMPALRHSRTALCRFSRRIYHAQHAKQGQVLDVGHVHAVLGILGREAGQTQHAIAFGRQGIDLLQPIGCIQRLHAFGALLVAAHGKNLLRSPFDENHGWSINWAVQSGHVAVDGIKGTSSSRRQS